MTLSRSRAAFTFVELLVVIVIIVILSGVIVTAYVSKAGEAKQAVAVQKIGALDTALKVFKLGIGRYPTTAEGLHILVDPPDDLKDKWKDRLKEKDLIDPWGRALLYECPVSHNTQAFDIWSLGADDTVGGEDENKDVNNWE